MFDPLVWFAKYGLHVAGLTACGYTAYKVWPRRFNPKKLMAVTFKRAGLFVKEMDAEIFPSLVALDTPDWGFVFNYRLPAGLSIEKFTEKTNVIATAFNGEVHIYGEGNVMTIEIMRRRLPRETYFNTELYARLSAGKAIPLVLGHTRKGIEVIDLAEVPHGIIGGESGAGKSVFIRQFLTGLALNKTPEEVRLTLIDLKHGVELADFAELPHVDGFASDVSEVGAILAKVNRIIDERGRLFRQAGVKRIDQYPKQLPYHVVIVDELAELVDTEDIERISRLGRAYGVHMLLSTQRPDANVISGQIKANCPLAVCFKVKNGVNSRIILDHEGGKNIPPIPGRAIVQYRGERYVQTIYLDEKKVGTLIKPIKGAKRNDETGISREGHRHLDVYF